MPRSAAARLLCCLSVALCAPASGGSEPPGPAAERWRLVRNLAEGAGAVAFDAVDGVLAVGDARGFWLRRADAGFVRVPLHGPVRDAVFSGRAGSRWLLVATETGLLRVEPGREPRRVQPAPGAEAADVVRLAALPHRVAVASAAGVFVSRDGLAWRPASRRWPSGPATAVALRVRGGADECWAVIEGRVWRTRLRDDEVRSDEADARPLVIAGAPRSDAPVDIAFDILGADAVVLFRDAFAVRETPGVSWRRVTPSLAPGVAGRRLYAARGRAWLATDRGLFSAASLAGPWRRAPGRVGTRSVHAIAGSGLQLFVASDGAMSEREGSAGPPVLSAASPSRGSEDLVAEDPPIAAVQRAALAHSRLGPERARSLERAVDRRGWLPVVSLRLAGGGDRDREVDFDSAFVSGETRRLVDRQHSQGWGYDASLVLSWDLGDTLYHPEAIDVSRESREILKLRDDVLDEVNQLYFERRRALAARTAANARGDAAAAAEHGLRAEELAAGLDAWTGGWFGRTRRAQRP